MVTGKGDSKTALSRQDIYELMDSGTPSEMYAGKKVLVLTPDDTRTCPLPELVDNVREIVGPHAAKLDFMVALGTHQPLAEETILDLYGITPEIRKEKYSNTAFLNHRWDLPGTLHRIGYLEKEETEKISGGHLKERVPIDINGAIFEYDLVIILGPVFPHEVVGYSGGAKYLFPGISGGEFLHFFHWLGAVVTCPDTIGIKNTPVREVINLAMQSIEVPVHCISLVVKSQAELYGMYVGDYKESWSAAADLSEQIHVVFKEKQFSTVLGICPEMYGEIWTGGKVMYKLEQAVAPGGKLIIYAPHIKEVSKTWGHHIEKIGYHTVGYFLGQPEKFKDVPRGVLAHSTHVKGIGRFEGGVDIPRIDVILATSIPEEECRKINLGYMDYHDIYLNDYREREDEGILFVEKAGETLYRIK